jgi:hypothetical protein
MKQVEYTLAILVLCTIAYFVKGETPLAEHNVSFLFEKSGCKVYSFEAMDGIRAKKHFFTTCRGAVLDKDEMNITEAE